MTDPLVCIGSISRPHGIRGELVLVGEPDPIAVLQQGDTIVVRRRNVDQAMTLERIRRDRQRWLVVLAGVPDRTAAEAFRQADVLIERSRLPRLDEGQYYFDDLLGLQVETENGETLGRIDDIIETAAHNVLQVIDDAGNELLIPHVDAFVLATDLDGGRMVVRLLEGMRS